jgi:GT2 family glycosyltransferase
MNESRTIQTSRESDGFADREAWDSTDPETSGRRGTERIPEMDPSSSRFTMTTDPPLISVCMAVYNAEPFVAEAVESILGQTLGDFEFLILDDGSTDGSLAILRRYAGQDPRIRLVSRANRGLVASLNELLDLARGEFIARMDADDVAMPERFQREVDFLRAHPDCVLVGSRVQLIDPEGDPLGDWCTLQEHEAIDATYLRGERVAAISHPAIMMCHDAVLAIGKYRPMEAIEDVDLFLRLAEYGRIANIPETLLKYRIHATNATKTASFHKKLDRVYDQIVRDARRRRNLPELPPLPPADPLSPEAEPLETKHDEMTKYVWWALSWGYVRTARKYARRIMTRAPFSLDSWRLMYCAIRGH